MRCAIPTLSWALHPPLFLFLFHCLKNSECTPKLFMISLIWVIHHNCEEVIDGVLYLPFLIKTSLVLYVCLIRKCIHLLTKSIFLKRETVSFRLLTSYLTACRTSQVWAICVQLSKNSSLISLDDHCFHVNVFRVFQTISSSPAPEETSLKNMYFAYTLTFDGSG